MKAFNRIIPAAFTTALSACDAATRNSASITDIDRAAPPAEVRPTVIALSPDLIAEVQTGRETATIRKGHKNYAIGPAVFDAKRAKIPIEITALQYKTFQELTAEDARLDGNVSKDELKASLKTYYPTMKNTDEVTIVHFRVLERNRR